MLRGPQTPGEIKTRTDRLCEFESTAEVETVLNDLASRSEGPLVARLPRQTGQKETRFSHLFCGSAPTVSPPPAQTQKKSPVDEKLAHLEQRIGRLEEQLRALQPKN